MLVILIGMQWYVNVALFCITMMTDDIKYLLMCWFALHISYFIVKVKSKSEVAQSCPTLCDPMDCSLPGSSVHGIFQARILEWVAISFSRRPSQPRDWTWVSWTAGRIFTAWAAREALGRKAVTHPDSIFKSRHHFPNKGRCSQSYGFSSSHVWMWELDHEEGWMLKCWWF